MAVITSDTFTVSTDTNLDAHAPDIGSTWALEEISTGGNPIICEAATDFMTSPLGGGSARALYTSRPNPAGVDYDIEVTAASAGPSNSDDPFFLLARMTDTSNYYSAGSYQAAAAADKKIFKQVATVKTQLATGDSGITTNDVMKFEVRDATKKLYKNGVEQLSTADNVLPDAGRAGFGMGNAWATASDDIGAGWDFDAYIVTEIVAETATSMPPLPSSMTPFLVR